MKRLVQSLCINSKPIGSPAWGGGLLVLVLLVAAGATHAQDPKPEINTKPKDKTLVFSTAGQGGFYYAVAQRVARRLRQEDDVQIRVMTSRGSLDNIRRMKQGRADLAFVQQDVLSDFLNDLSYQDNQQAPIQVVGQIFFHYLHIFIRRPIHIGSASDLRGMKIWPGHPGSGTRETALEFLDTVGLPTHDITDMTANDVEEGSASSDVDYIQRVGRWFKQRKIDLAFQVGVPGDPRIVRAMQDGEFTLYPLDYDTLRLMARQRQTAERLRQTTIGTIPKQTYPGLDARVRTLIIPGLLVARRSTAKRTALMRKLYRYSQQAWAAVRDQRRQALTRLDREQGLNLAMPSPPTGVPPLDQSGLPLVPDIPRRGPAWPSWLVSNLHVVAEMVHMQNASVVDDVATDFPGLLETVSSGKTRTLMVAQATLNAGLIDLYKDLLSITADTNEIYFQKIPPEAAGLAFSRYAAIIAEHQSDQSILAIGIRRQENGRPEVYLNPQRQNNAHTLQENDELIVVAYHPLREGDLPAPAQ